MATDTKFSKLTLVTVGSSGKNGTACEAGLESVHTSDQKAFSGPASHCKSNLLSVCTIQMLGWAGISAYQ